MNAKRTSARLGRVQVRSRDARRNHILDETKRLVETLAGLAVETYGIGGMMRIMGDALGDIALGTFLRTLKREAE